MSAARVTDARLPRGRGLGARPLIVLVAALWGASLNGCAALLPTLQGAAPALAPAPDLGLALEGRVLRGAVHCHCVRSHDATGSLQRVAAAAARCEVGFVALSDHCRAGQGQLSGPVPESMDGVIFLPGAELPGGGGSILGLDLPRGFDPPAQRGVAEVQIAAIHSAGGLTVLAHAEEYEAWETPGWDALEVVNLHAMARDAPRLGTVLSALFLPPGRFFRRLSRFPEPSVLARWDAAGLLRRVPGVGGCDAHEGIRMFGRLGGRLGSYEECFRALSTHLIVRGPGRAGVREALAAGRGYVAFETLGSARGFRFVASRGGALAAEMGEELPFEPGLSLAAAAPGGARLRLLCDGEEVAAGDSLLRFEPAGPGVYRVEATLEGDPFVLSNPIYLRAPIPGGPAPQTPRGVLAPSSRVRGD